MGSQALPSPQTGAERAGDRRPERHRCQRGLLAHTAISRFVDHLPYYRQETIYARSGLHTRRSRLAAGTGQVGAALEPLHELHKR